MSDTTAVDISSERVSALAELWLRWGALTSVAWLPVDPAVIDVRELARQLWQGETTVDEAYERVSAVTRGYADRDERVPAALIVLAFALHSWKNLRGYDDPWIQDVATVLGAWHAGWVENGVEGAGPGFPGLREPIGDRIREGLRLDQAVEAVLLLGIPLPMYWLRY